MNTFFWKIVVASLFPCYAFFQMSLLNTLHPYFQVHITMTATQFTWLGSLYWLTDALLLLPVGILLDKAPLKNLLIAGITLSAVGALLMATSHTYHDLLWARAIGGIGHAFSLISCFRLTHDLLPKNQQPMLIGLIFCIALLGAAIAQAPLAVLAEHFSLHFLLYLNTAIGLLIGTALAIFITKQPCTSTEKLQLKALYKAAKNAQNWLSPAYIILLNLPVMILGALWGSNYLQSIKHASSSTASIATTLLFIGMMLGNPLFGKITEYLSSRTRPFLLASYVSLVILALIILTQNKLLLLVSFFALGILSGAQSIGYQIITENNPNGVSTSMGFCNVLIMFGTAALSILLIKAATAFEASFSFFHAIFGLLFLCILLSAIITHSIKDTYLALKNS